MEQMLEYIRKINEVDTEGIEPLSNVFSKELNVFREDVVTNGSNREAFLAQAPEKEKDYFVVPKTV